MLTIVVSNKEECSRLEHGEGPIVLGHDPQSDGPVHTIQDAYCSAQQLRVEALPERRVCLTNLSKKVPVKLATGDILQPGATSICSVPVRMSIGRTLIEIEGEINNEFETIARPIVQRDRPPLLPGLRDLATVNPTSGEKPEARFHDGKNRIRLRTRKPGCTIRMRHSRTKRNSGSAS